MKNILTNILFIVKRDIRNIVSNRAAIVVILALIFLPSLYAWFNIKASWDPYSNTEGVNVAISSLDEGATVEDKDINIGDEVILNLKDNDEMGWLFVSEDEAIQGVEHGDYYAAIVIPEDFSEKLTSITTDEIEKPELEYYINEKVNAISPKVTKSGASAIVENIHTNFLKEANETVISVFNTIGFELEHNYVDIEKARDAIFRLEDDIPEIYANLQLLDQNLGLADGAIEAVGESIDRVDSFKSRAEQLNSQLVKRLESNEATVERVIDSIADRLQETKQMINKIPNFTSDISQQGDEDLNRLISSLHERQNKLSDAEDRLDEIHQYLKKQDNNLKESTRLEDLQTSLNDNKNNLQQLKNNLQLMVRDLERGNHPGVAVVERTESLIDSMSDSMTSLNETYESFIIPQVELVIEQSEQLITTINETLADAQNLNEQALSYIQSLDKMDNPNLQETKEKLENAANLIDTNSAKVDTIVTVLEVLDRISNSERITALLDRFQSLQQSLADGKETIDSALNLINQGTEIGGNVLTQLEAALDTIGNKFEEVQQSFDNRTQKALNDAINELKKVDQGINDRFTELQQTESSIRESLSDIEEKVKNPERTISLINGVIDRVDTGIDQVDNINKSIQTIDEFIDSDFLTNEIDRILVIRDELKSTNESIGQVIERIKDAKQSGRERLRDVDRLASEMNQSLDDIIHFVSGNLLNSYKVVINDATQSLQDISGVLKDVDDKLPTVRKAIDKTKEGIAKGHDKVDVANEHFPEAKETVQRIADKIRELEEKGDLNQLINVLTTDPVAVSEFLAEPIVLNEHELFPIPNYGSAMNPFYTTLALWVGGLLLISSLKVDVAQKREFKSYEVYGGRLIIFLGIGVLQSLIVTLGNIVYINAYIVNKFAYVMFGVLISVVFMSIIYTLVSVFGNTGKVMAIILLVMQLGGSGGTFPIQMAPPFFQKIYSFIPFTHAINLLREAIGGIIWDVAIKHIMFLIAYFFIALIVGIGLKRIVNRSSDKFTEKARESEIVI